MTTKEIVQKSFTIDVTASNDEKLSPINVWMPPGWVSIFTTFCSALDKLGGRIQRVHYSKGTLQVVAHWYKDPSLADAIAWLSQGLAKQSSMTCLVDPHGLLVRRRKAYEGWPPLSSNAFVEYANQLEE